MVFLPDETELHDQPPQGTDKGETNVEAIVLAAGKGTRMCSELPKVLRPVFGKPVLGYVLETLAGTDIKSPYVVVGYEAEKVRSF